MMIRRLKTAIVCVAMRIWDWKYVIAAHGPLFAIIIIVAVWGDQIEASMPDGSKAGGVFLVASVILLFVGLFAIESVPPPRDSRQC